MAYYKTVSAGADEGAWDSGTAYSIGDMVSYTGYDQVSSVGLRFVCIQAHTSHTPTLSFTDAYWRMAHPVSSLQLLNAIGALATSSDFNGSGNQWTRLYRFDGRTGLTGSNQRFCLTLQNEGLSAQDDIVIVLNQQPSSSSTPTGLIRIGGGTGWLGASGGEDDQDFVGNWSSGVGYATGEVVYYGGYWWVCVNAHTSVSAPSASNSNWLQLPSSSDADAYGPIVNRKEGYYHAHWDGGTGDIPFWFWSNKGRIMWVTKSDSRYHFAHAGLLFRFGPRSQAPFPVVLSANAGAINEPYDYSSHSNFPFNTSTRIHALDSAGNWITSTSNIVAMPYEFANVYAGRNAGGDLGLEEVPVYLNPGGLQGKLDGAFYVGPQGMVSGNELSAGSDEFVVFEDVNRGQSGGFVAFKKD